MLASCRSSLIWAPSKKYSEKPIFTKDTISFRLAIMFHSIQEQLFITTFCRNDARRDTRNNDAQMITVVDIPPKNIITVFLTNR